MKSRTSGRVVLYLGMNDTTHIRAIELLSGKNEFPTRGIYCGWEVKWFDKIDLGDENGLSQDNEV